MTGLLEMNSRLLFSLPLELREQVYKEAFASPSQGSQLLRTSKEVRNEARKFLFLRRVRFSNQKWLFDCVEQSPKHLLRQITEISLTVEDPNLRSILESHFSSNQLASPPELKIPMEYDSELERLKRSLQELPNVKIITIRAFKSPRNHFYQGLLSKVLGMLGSLYPTLTDLRLEGDMRSQSLAYLASLKHLESLSFDGFSTSTPTETAKILASLNNLSSLSLIPHLPTSLTPKPQSFDGHVARKFDQLASFSVTERKAPALFFTSEVLVSLHNHKKLNNLSISLSYLPDSETLEALQSFLSRSAISCLKLDWPDLRSELLGEHSLIPEHVQVLWSRADNQPEAVSILQMILQVRQEGRMQALSKVVLVRSVVYATMGNQVGATKKNLQALGVQVAWCTETA